VNRGLGGLLGLDGLGGGRHVDVCGGWLVMLVCHPWPAQHLSSALEDRIGSGAAGRRPDSAGRRENLCLLADFKHDFLL
jgi:hypothetical protein